MDTQELDIPAAHTPTSGGSKRLPIAAAVAALVLLGAVAVWFFALRALPTQLTWAPSKSAIAPNGELSVSGKVTPAQHGRDVMLQSASSASGPWQSIGQSGTTDDLGQFAITFRPQMDKSEFLRVVIEPDGRLLEGDGRALKVKLLALSSVTLSGAGESPTQKPIKFTAKVDPAEAGRPIAIEQSSDGVRWTQVGSSVQTKADGTASISTPAPAAGQYTYRAHVADDSTYAAATSPAVKVSVEDIKAAGAAYLALTLKWNAAGAKFGKIIDEENAGTVSFTRMTAAAAVMSQADTDAANALRAYPAWPASVKSLIDRMANIYTLDADNDHELSQVKTVSAWNTISNDGEANFKSGGDTSALIRQALGLPKRGS